MTAKDFEFYINHKDSDIDDLILHASRYPEIDMRAVAVQLKGRSIALRKLPSWASVDDVLYPEHISMEQCSSEQTGRYKGEMARRLYDSLLKSVKDVTEKSSLQGVDLADLTGGFGVDAVMMYGSFDHCRLTFVERNPDLCRLATHNFPLLGVDCADVRCGECESLLPDLVHQDIIFIDPARRDVHGRKTVALSDCLPDITLIQDQLVSKGDIVIVKLSPMLDMRKAMADLKCLREMHVVSVEGECKELLAVLSSVIPEHGVDGVDIYCVNIVKGVSCSEHYTLKALDSAICEYTSVVGRYLYEPNASIMKANAQNVLAALRGMAKLHPNSHLLTSDTKVEDFPGRRFEVIEVLDFSKKGQKALVSNFKKANITVRNFPLSVAQLRKRLKISEGGNDYLFATTLADNSLVIIVCKPF